MEGVAPEASFIDVAIGQASVSTSLAPSISGGVAAAREVDAVRGRHGDILVSGLGGCPR